MKVKKRFVALFSAMIMAVSMMSVGASAYSTPGTFNVHYMNNVPTSATQPTETNYASVPTSRNYMIVYCNGANASSNCDHCNMTVAERASWEQTYHSFGYVGQQKNIGLKTRYTTQVNYTTALVKNNSNYSYGNCSFGGTCS